MVWFERVKTEPFKNFETWTEPSKKHLSIKPFRGLVSVLNLGQISIFKFLNVKYFIILIFQNFKDFPKMWE